MIFIIGNAYLFSLGVPACRTRFHIRVNLSTMQHAFRVFREAIYDSSVADLVLSEKLEIDESIVWQPP